MTALQRSHVRGLARYVVLLAGFLLWVPNGSAQKPTRGEPAPDIDLPTLGGGHVKLSSLKGHPVVVTFWGTWCPPCREEFPELVAAQKKHRESGLVVLAVNQRDQELSNKAVEDFVKEFGADFAVALDTHGRARRSFRLIGLPTMVFVDASGVIQATHPGPITTAEFDRGLATILPTK
ncbi:MAG TPA: TlpA disulfide reductase family protein [Gemmatimonadaceae bacterium]|nr:TlpA disulfide reductase family protein [Gemmatimonadaceae bacterium]